MSDADTLDDPKQRSLVDKENMISSLTSFPFQLEKGWELSQSLDMGRFRQGFSSLLISGMGGSAIGGDVLGDILRSVSDVRVEVNRTYSPPKHVDKDVLHVAVSYSGNTEETLSSFRRGLDLGISSMGISSGGALEKLCIEKSIPFLKIPGGEKPRAALGYMLSSLMGATTAAGIHDFSGTIMEAVQSARTATASVSPDVPAEKNLSKQLAMWLGASVPLIIASSEVFSAAERLKTQFNENSKRFAWLLPMPESNHNDWIPLFMDRTAGGYKAILFDSVEDEPMLQRRMSVIEELLSSRMEVRRVSSNGKGILDSLLKYIVIGDNASYYLAMLDSTDPSPVTPIEELKRALSSRKA